MKSVTDRFLTYVKYHTTSDENATSVPSTPRQKEFAEFLRNECTSIGLTEVTVDKYGYVYATLPGNAENVPTIGFIAHMDTSPDASGENVKPNIVEKYDGGNIHLSNVTLSPKEFPSLNNYIGDSLITADGTTLLGADDKAGIAEILTAMEYLAIHPEIPRGKIRIAFTPDEEIGRGADYFDVNGFCADFAYTVDGSALGELQYENFNAARVQIQISGRSVHPGTAKSTMINAALLAVEIASLLPEREIPAKTEGYEGFFHLISFYGTVSSATLSYIIRDFEHNSFERRKAILQMIIERKNTQYPNAITLDIRDEYYNMAEKIEPHINIVHLAEKAMHSCGISPKIEPIRGGTDGARLSFMGLPCPNIFTGGHNFHGPYEYIPVSSMKKAVETIVKIVELNASKTR